MVVEVIFLLSPQILGGWGQWPLESGNRKVAVGRESDCVGFLPLDECSHYFSPDPSAIGLDWLTYSKLEQELSSHSLNTS